jgi:hypothetical protein
MKELPMSMPGFTAEHSLVPSSVEYHYAGSNTSNGVSPEFLDFVKEAFESVVDGLSKTFDALADSTKIAFDALKNAASHAGRQYTCSQMMAGMFECNASSPALGVADITKRCVNESGGEPAIVAACGMVGAAFYPLLTEYCKNPQARSQGQLISQVCG